MGRILLTVSGEIPAELDQRVGAGERPRLDYIEMASAFDADLLDYVRARALAGPFGRLVARMAGPNALLAWTCFRRRRDFDAIFTDGEQVGIPLAALLRLIRRRTRHLMIGHVLSVRKKMVPFKLLRLGGRIDRVVVYASSQRRYAVDVLAQREGRVVLTSFMVDTRFFAPVERVDKKRPTICSAGLEFRDYPTLIEAVRGLDVDVVLAAASPWSKRRDSSSSINLPRNVTVRQLSFTGLRDLYACSEIVVVPLVETDFQAGITTILEAMAMGKAVICTRTTGQTDTIVDDETGVYVPPGDVDALRTAIKRLLADADLRRRLASNARRWVVENADIEVYATRLARIVAETLRGVR